MSRLYMLIGLPGSGKSTWAKEQAANDKNIIICSSDEMRKQRGLAEDDTSIFEDLHKRIRRLLRNGRDVIYDATNINRKRRMHFLRTLPDGVTTYAELFIVDPDICKERQKLRDRVVPDEVIDKMLLGFQLPGLYEGFDHINTQYVTNKTPEWLTINLDLFEQDNPHHTKSLGEHQRLAGRGARYYDDYLMATAYNHDIGKYYTKTIDDDGIAHYYGHENVGAYYWLLGTKHFPFDSLYDYYYIALLINWHMRPFVWDKSTGCAERERELLGDKMFEDLMKLHKADVESK